MAEETRNFIRDSRFAAIGVLPGLHGALLLPEGTDADEDALRRGDWDRMPEAWTLVHDAWDTGACGPTPEPFNSVVLSGDAEGLRVFAEGTDPNLRALARAVRARLGADDAVEQAEQGLDPRVAAYATATDALLSADRGDHEVAQTGLRAASELVADLSPCAAARYIGESCSVAPMDHRVLMDLERAAGSLEGLGFESLRGELLMTSADIALALGGERPAMLQHAVMLLQRATQALPRRTHPVAFAVCQMNIGVAYLSMPMGEHAGRLRGAIGVQSLREALEILTPEGHPELWESATLNLANALQHLPSAHPGQNLAESVDLYERLLTRRSSPTAERGRVLANLGNALGHLARFEESRERLVEARGVFEALGDDDAVVGVDGVLREVEACRQESAKQAEGVHADE